MASFAMQATPEKQSGTHSFSLSMVFPQNVE
jgi:hypothetical protein